MYFACQQTWAHVKLTQQALHLYSATNWPLRWPVNLVAHSGLFGPFWAFLGLFGHLQICKALNTYSAAKAAIASLREAFRQAVGHTLGTRMDMEPPFWHDMKNHCDLCTIVHVFPGTGALICCKFRVQKRCPHVQTRVTCCSCSWGNAHTVNYLELISSQWVSFSTCIFGLLVCCRLLVHHALTIEF